MSGFLPALTGSFSTPAGDNPTSAIMAASFRATGEFARYVNCEVAPDDLAAAVRGAVAMGWLGFNCSLPHKQAVLAHLDELTPAAALIGAVNCVRIVREPSPSAPERSLSTPERSPSTPERSLSLSKGRSDDTVRLIGDNTDGKGFVESLTPLIDPRGRHAVLLGAGGAARAIAVELALAGARRITVVNRSADRGRELAALVASVGETEASYVPWETAFAVPSDAEILVNATSIGMAPQRDLEPDLDYGTLRPGLVVADVIPNPATTRFLRRADEAGATTLDGRGMLVNQAAVAIQQWTGSPADRQAMRTALDQALDDPGSLADTDA